MIMQRLYAFMHKTNAHSTTTNTTHISREATQIRTVETFTHFVSATANSHTHKSNCHTTANRGARVHSIFK